MESQARDLTTASSAAVMQQKQPSAASVTEDEGGVDVSVRSATANEAVMRFQSRMYDECLELLYRLLQKKEDDPKILHNIAIVEFFRDDCSGPKKLLYALDNIKKKNQELARASLEQAEAASISVNKGAMVSKGSSMPDQKLGVSSNIQILYSDEFDVSVASLNTAIVWFHLHEYRKALSVLEPLSNNIEPLYENVVLHICLLILDATLACPDAKNAVICNYPFTTSGILMGHIETNHQRFQVTDTPGLLSRSNEKRNNLEKLTIAVLSHLPTAILFVHDLSGECGTSPSDQVGTVMQTDACYQLTILSSAH